MLLSASLHSHSFRGEIHVKQVLLTPDGGSAELSRSECGTKWLFFCIRAIRFDISEFIFIISLRASTVLMDVSLSAANANVCVCV